MGVSKNNGAPKSSILIGCSIINHPFWGTPIFGNTQNCYHQMASIPRLHIALVMMMCFDEAGELGFRRRFLLLKSVVRMMICF